MARFADRREAGRRLADLVAAEVGPEDTVVLALPRGGVPVAYEVATRVGAPLDVLSVRKLGVPWQTELAFGAISTGGVVVIDRDLVDELELGEEVVNRIVERERVELDRRERLYRGGVAPRDLRGKTVVVVDDGIATGSTMRAALASLVERGAGRRIVACPVAAEETVRALRRDADAVLCVLTPVSFLAVGAWYEDFSTVEEDEVRDLLIAASRKLDSR